MTRYGNVGRRTPLLWAMAVTLSAPTAAEARFLRVRAAQIVVPSVASSMATAVR